MIGASAGFVLGQNIVCGGGTQTYVECSKNSEGRVFQMCQQLKIKEVLHLSVFVNRTKIEQVVGVFIGFLTFGTFGTPYF